MKALVFHKNNCYLMQEITLEAQSEVPLFEEKVGTIKDVKIHLEIP